MPKSFGQKWIITVNVRLDFRGAAEDYAEALATYANIYNQYHIVGSFTVIHWANQYIMNVLIGDDK